MSGGKSGMSIPAIVRTVVLISAMLAFPCGMLAQHGAGGGHVGGAMAGGGSMTSSGGHPTGVATKDDLRDFHEIMAVQASREQKSAYAAMIKSTATAGVELQEFEGKLSKENNQSALASQDKNLADALETARTLNKKFLEGFSEPQKSGLKEIIKRLNKTDSELAQQARLLEQSFEAKSGNSQMASSAQGLDQALANFRRAQVQLGEEMSIPPSGDGQDSAFNLLPAKHTITVVNQPVAITVLGTVSRTAPVAGGQNKFAVALSVDLSDLQLNIASVLSAELNKEDRCGEHIAIKTATLGARPPASLVVAQLHYERWTCATMFGRETMNELVEGDGTVEIELMPAVAEDGSLQLAGKIGSVDAVGALGESLRSGYLGETLRDKTADSILSILRQGGDFKAALPSGARSYATLTRALFQGSGTGRLTALLNGELRVPDENLSALTSALKEGSSQLSDRPSTPELMSR